MGGSFACSPLNTCQSLLLLDPVVAERLGGLSAGS
jgi:hypothetical protein